MKKQIRVKECVSIPASPEVRVGLGSPFVVRCEDDEVFVGWETWENRAPDEGDVGYVTEEGDALYVGVGGDRMNRYRPARGRRGGAKGLFEDLISGKIRI